MPTIRPLHPTDSLDALTALLHAAYASLAAQGWNFTAVDQSVATTRERLAGAQAFVARPDEWRHVFTIRRQRGMSPCCLQGSHGEAFDVQSVGVAGWQDIGHIVAIGFGQFRQPAVDEVGIHQRAIPREADHVVSLACAGCGMEAVEHVVQAAALAGNAMLCQYTD